jgi:hypothetical protein
MSDKVNFLLTDMCRFGIFHDLDFDRRDSKGKSLSLGEFGIASHSIVCNQSHGVVVLFVEVAEEVVFLLGAYLNGCSRPTRTKLLVGWLSVLRE